MKKKYKTLSKRLVLGTANLGTCKYGINKYKISNNNKKKYSNMQLRMKLLILIQLIHMDLKKI